MPGPTQKWVLYQFSPTTNGSGSLSGQGAGWYGAGVQFTISATPAANWDFVNWTATAGNLSNPNATSTTFTMPAQNATVTANFEQRFLLNINVSGSGSVNIASGNYYAEGATINLLATANEGNLFQEWIASVGGPSNFSPGTASSTVTFTMPAANETIEARFEAATFRDQGEFKIGNITGGAGITIDTWDISDFTEPINFFYDALGMPDRYTVWASSSTNGTVWIMENETPILETGWVSTNPSSYTSTYPGVRFHSDVPDAEPSPKNGAETKPHEGPDGRNYPGLINGLFNMTGFQTLIVRAEGRGGTVWHYQLAK